jgi:flagellar motor switch protein FliG
LTGNLEQLEDAGLIVETLPKAHSEVVRNLSDEEVKVIVAVAARLRKADQDEGLGTKAAYTRFIHF